MTEFKQIPQAVKYEMDKEGNVQTIAKQTPIIPHPRGSRTVMLYVNDVERKSFNVDELASEIFGINKVKANKVVSEESPAPKAVEEKKEAVKPDAKKIMALDTFMSVKIWKLHQSGMSNSEICDIVKYPHISNVPSTIEKYKESKKLRDKADKIKV